MHLPRLEFVVTPGSLVRSATALPGCWSWMSPWMWKLDDAMRFRKSRNVATYFKGVGEGMIKMMLSDVEKNSLPTNNTHQIF